MGMGHRLLTGADTGVSRRDFLKIGRMKAGGFTSIALFEVERIASARSGVLNCGEDYLLLQPHAGVPLRRTRICAPNAKASERYRENACTAGWDGAGNSELQ